MICLFHWFVSELFVRAHPLTTLLYVMIIEPSCFYLIKIFFFSFLYEEEIYITDYFRITREDPVVSESILLRCSFLAMCFILLLTTFFVCLKCEFLSERTPAVSSTLLVSDSSL